MLFLTILLCIGLSCGQNLFKNADFEGEFSSDNWYCRSCPPVQRNSDAHEGQSSGRIYNRPASWSGIAQEVSLIPDARYHFYIHVKLLNEYPPGTGWNRVELMIRVEYQDGTEEYAIIGAEPYQRNDQGWQKIGGDYRVQNKGVSYAQFYVQIPASQVNYLVDTASMTEIVFPSDWWNEANARIDQHRKNNIALNVNIGDRNPADVTVELRQRKHGFPFGTAVQSALLTGSNTAYQQFFNNTFDWAVMEYEMKWLEMERIRGDINFGLSDPGIEKLLADGKEIRGHAVYWGVPEFVPDWLKTMSVAEVNAEIDRRANYVVPHYRGKVRHWDVNNEQLHGSFFEENTANHNILSEMFTKTRAHDPDVKLFLNDYAILSTSQYTHAYVKSARHLKDLNAPIYGIGIQSHLQGFPQIDQLIDRLETVTEAGLPIWITELDVEIESRLQRAQGYENVLRLYFSWPQIEGIMLWGFWDQAHWRPNAALVEGQNFEINVAGRRVVDLLKNEWMTSADFNPTSDENRFEIRGFHGDYVVVIKENGEVVREEEFTLKKSEDITIFIIL